MSGHETNATTVTLPRRRSAFLALLAALALALTSLSATAPATGETATRVLVTAAQGVDDAVAAIVGVGGTIVDRFDTFGILVAEVPDAAVLSTDARIATVEPDTVLAPQAKPQKIKDARAATRSVAATINATGLGDGSGVGVAVLDTGVTPSIDTFPNGIENVDVSGEGHPLDGFGHGTFMAGLIAGKTADGWSGVAPGVDLVSIKVADYKGRASISSVIAGLAVAKQAHDEGDVDVLLLAAGGPASSGPPDALRLALRQLWADGLVVVVPSGNRSNQITTPGVDEYLLTAGALDDNGTDGDSSDDETADFSGASRDGSKPDLLAPGVSLVSTRAPGSTVDKKHPDSRIGELLFRGSGTSQAAAVTAGAAALLLAAVPTELSPDDVKSRLVAAAAANGGHLDVAGAVDADGAPNVNGHLPPIEPLGDPVVPDEEPSLPPGLQKKGSPIEGFTWDGNSWIGNSWVGNSWIGNSWIGNSWIGNSWVGNSWIGNSWIGNSWIGNSWVGNSWIGNSWIGNSWVGNSWVGNSWVGNSWVGNSWVGNSWVGNSWVGNSWVSDNWVGHTWN